VFAYFLLHQLFPFEINVFLMKRPSTSDLAASKAQRKKIIAKKEMPIAVILENFS